MFKKVILPTGILLGLASLSWAQAPRYIPPPPPSKGYGIELRFRYLLAPDIQFTGLGTLSLPSGLSADSDLILGTSRTIEYDDGYLYQDFTEGSLVEGMEGQQAIPSPNDQATANFGYQDAGQVDPNDPTMLLFHRYSSVASPNEEFSGKNSSSVGWEINYTRYLRWNRKVGIQVGFSFNGFDSRFNDSISADLYVQEFRHQMADGVTVPDLPDPVEHDDGSITQDPYEGEVVREDVASGDLLEWAVSEETADLIAGGATVDTKADLRSSLYNFRAGPTYTFGFGEHFGMQVGAGVTAIYYAGVFSAYEALQNPAGGLGPSRDLVTTSNADWQLGGYLDASAKFNFTDRVNLFSGMQVQSGSTYTQQNEDRHASVDFSSQVYVHAGLGIRF